jgi:hypothetical protein
MLATFWRYLDQLVFERRMLGFQIVVGIGYCCQRNLIQSRGRVVLGFNFYKIWRGSKEYIVSVIRRTFGLLHFWLLQYQMYRPFASKKET